MSAAVTVYAEGALSIGVAPGCEAASLFLGDTGGLNLHADRHSTEWLREFALKVFEMADILDSGEEPVR